MMVSKKRWVNGMTRRVKKGKKIMKMIGIGMIIFILLLFILRFGAQRIILYYATKDMEISEIEEVELCGIPQKILIEGKTKDLPIMIMVHGGPGLPIPFGVGMRGEFPQLSEKFLLVQWDQFGTGINYSKDTSLTIDDYVVMLHDLVIRMEEKYPNREIFLYGMSWGTILNTKIANMIPDKIDGVIAYGQVTSIPIWKQAMHDKAQELELSAKDNKELEDAMNDTSESGFYKMLNIVSKKTSLYYYKGEEASNWDFYMHSFHVMISPDYTLLDAIHAYSNPSGDSLMQQVMDIDMSEEQQLIRVPFLIMQGEDDFITPITYNESLVKLNKHMSLSIFKNAGHIPTNKSYEEIFHDIIQFRDMVTD